MERPSNNTNEVTEKNIEKQFSDAEKIDEAKALQSLDTRKILIPIFIGLGAMVYMIFQNDSISLDTVLDNLGKARLEWIALALIVLIVRDGGYVYRIRHLTGGELSWNSGLYVILLWEFASAITPSVVGGTAIVVFIIAQEGIGFGRSLAYVMLTAVLDNCFFVFASFFVIFVLDIELFPSSESFVLLGYELPLQEIFNISVGLIAFYTLLMSFGLFVRPVAFKRFLVTAASVAISIRFPKKWRRPFISVGDMFRIRSITRFLIWVTCLGFPRSWKDAAVRSGDETILASKVLRRYGWSYWFKAGVATLFIWSARYLMLNCLIAAFSGIDLTDHITIFSRQIIMWIVMLLSPTPGSAGSAELSFEIFFREFFNGGFETIVGILWRLITYYAYLLIGIFIIPRWISRTFGKKK